MRIARAIPVAILSFIVYIVFSGSTSIYDIVTGSLVAIATGLITANIVVQKASKPLNPIRWIWTLVYAVIYFFYAEVRAHTDVIRRILSPKMPVKPGIVRVPYDVKTDYALTLIANSITNTPGTLVVDVDTDRKILYVHWIDVKAVEPELTRKYISELFEKYAKKIFD